MRQLFCVKLVARARSELPDLSPEAVRDITCRPRKLSEALRSRRTVQVH